MIYTNASTKALLLERHAMRGLVSEAREAKVDLQVAVDDAVRALRHLREAGVHRDAIWDALATLRDAAINADHPHNLTLDNAGEHFEWLDLTEADSLMEEMK